MEMARQLARKDFHIVISGRNEEKLLDASEQLKREGASTQILLMDVSDAVSIRQAAKVLDRDKVKLDVLINNAGIIIKEDRSLLSEDINIFGTIINTNAFGPLRVIRNFLPLMNSQGRIINISSGGGSMSDPVGGWSPAYCVSKTLLNAITRQIAEELAVENISVNAVCPGWVRTQMGGKSANRSVEKGAETPVWLAADAPQGFTGKIFRDKKEIDW